MFSQVLKAFIPAESEKRWRLVDHCLMTNKSGWVKIGHFFLYLFTIL